MPAIEVNAFFWFVPAKAVIFSMTAIEYLGARNYEFT